MPLRDRIAETMRSCDLRGDSRQETADAILADPEIAALRDVAEAANKIARELLDDGAARVQSANNLDAALARLEEARRG